MADQLGLPSDMKPHWVTACPNRDGANMRNADLQHRVFNLGDSAQVARLLRGLVVGAPRKGYAGRRLCKIMYQGPEGTGEFYIHPSVPLTHDKGLVDVEKGGDNGAAKRTEKEFRIPGEISTKDGGFVDISDTAALQIKRFYAEMEKIVTKVVSERSAEIIGIKGANEDMVRSQVLTSAFRRSKNQETLEEYPAKMKSKVRPREILVQEWIGAYDAPDAEFLDREIANIPAGTHSVMPLLSPTELWVMMSTKVPSVGITTELTRYQYQPTTKMDRKFDFRAAPLASVSSASDAAAAAGNATSTGAAAADADAKVGAKRGRSGDAEPAGNAAKKLA